MGNVNRFSTSSDPQWERQQINKNKHSFDSGPFTRQLSKWCQECFCTFHLQSNRKNRHVRHWNKLSFSFSVWFDFITNLILNTEQANYVSVFVCFHFCVKANSYQKYHLKYFEWLWRSNIFTKCRRFDDYTFSPFSGRYLQVSHWVACGLRQRRSPGELRYEPPSGRCCLWECENIKKESSWASAVFLVPMETRSNGFALRAGLDWLEVQSRCHTTRAS